MEKVPMTKAGYETLNAELKTMKESERPAIIAAISGEVGIAFTNFSETSTFVKAGRLRGLGVSSPKRVAVMPDLPTIAETLPGFEVSRNYNLLTLPRTSEFFQHPMGVVVVADTEEICDRALRLLQIEWEERPFILDMEESLKPTAPKIMPEVKRLHPKAKEPNTVFTDMNRKICLKYRLLQPSGQIPMPV